MPRRKPRRIHGLPNAAPDASVAVVHPVPRTPDGRTRGGGLRGVHRLGGSRHERRAAARKGDETPANSGLVGFWHTDHAERKGSPPGTPGCGRCGETPLDRGRGGYHAFAREVLGPREEGRARVSWPRTTDFVLVRD